MNQRLGAYRRMASARSVTEVDAQIAELTDRYGAPPTSVLDLAEYARIRVAADRLGLESVDREGSAVVLKFRPDAKLDPAWLLNLVQNRGDLSLVPPAVLRLDLTRPVAAPPPQARRPTPVIMPPGRLRPKPSAAGAKPIGPAASWWTTRATTGDVAPGFTREEILAETPPDPRATGGLFERLAHVLAELSRGLLAG